jgi:uncharacterized protein YbjT (DUF2867 family)
MKVLMIGATGEFASLAIPAFKSKDIKIKGLVRNERAQQKAINNGVDETAIGNLEDFDSLVKAMYDVDAVFHLNPAFIENEAQMGINMVRASQQVGIKKFVFSSVYHTSLSLVNHAGKRPVEEALFESNMAFVILQPAMFMQTLQASWPNIIQTGTFPMPYSKHVKMSYVDYRDVTEVAARALSDNLLNNGIFELSSGASMDRVELSEMISDILDTPIEAKEISFDEFSRKAKIPDGYLKEGMRAMFGHYDRYGFQGGNSLVLESILGRKPRTIAAYLKELASGE